MKTKIVKQDGKLTEEAVKLFKFSGMEPTPINMTEKQIWKGTQQKQLRNRTVKYRIRRNTAGFEIK